LAVMVEDHPLDYRTFEGTIPEGNYGAGTVMVWDEGTYKPVEAPGRNGRGPAEQLEAGHLRFVLQGQKLRGEFSLVKLKRGKGNEWLLFKHRDDHASDEDVLEKDRSAISGREMEEIAGSAAPKKKARRVKARPSGEAVETRKGGAPHDVKPMLATLVGQPFDRAGWLFEVKWDGYRAIAGIEKGN